MRVEIFPSIPLEIALDMSQEEEVEKKKGELRHMSFILHMSQTQLTGHTLVLVASLVLDQLWSALF